MVEAMADMVSAGQTAQRVPTTIDPFAAGSAMMAMIDRLFAYRNELRRRGTPKSAQRDTLTTILFQTLSGIQT